MTPPTVPVLQIGDPRLREVAAPVTDLVDPAFQQDKARLSGALEAFRAAYGFGRAIAATQLGIPRRMIALNLGQGPFVMLNPEVVWRSDETFTLWDDCMSFPWLFVRVRRHRSISVRYQDETGGWQAWPELPMDVSELLQHEIDHLDGLLATDRALDRDALVSRETFNSNPDSFRRMVDYVIVPTI